MICSFFIIESKLCVYVKVADNIIGRAAEENTNKVHVQSLSTLSTVNS